MTCPTQSAAPPSLIERVRSWYRRHIHAQPEDAPVRPDARAAQCRRRCRLARHSDTSRSIVFTCTEHVFTAEGAEGRRGLQKVHPLRSSACSAVHLNTYSRSIADRPDRAAPVVYDLPPHSSPLRLQCAHRVVVAARAAAAVTALAQARAAGLLDAEQPDFAALTALMRRMPDYRAALAELEDCRAAAHGLHSPQVGGGETIWQNSAPQCGWCGSPLVTPHPSLRW